MCFHVEFRKNYYKKYFPFESFFKWVTRNGKYKTTRELSFTLDDGKYNRYLYFDSSQIFYKNLMEYTPLKIDIGAVFNELNRFKIITPILREFVIDIDIDDYNDVRFCCSSNNICNKCWILLVCAAKVIHHVFNEQFGMKHILTVFSGRRGIHFWVCDDIAMSLDEVSRTSIVKYFNIFQANNVNSEKKSFVCLNETCCLFEEIFDIIEPYFDKFCQEQQIFAIQERRERLLSLIPRQLINMIVLMDNELNWSIIKEQLKNEKLILMNIVFTYLYPRIDVNVSTQLNHLLKAPFCVHPQTSKISVPIPLEQIESFDVEKVPTLASIHSITNSTKYPLEESIRYFDSFVNSLLE